MSLAPSLRGARRATKQSRNPSAACAVPGLLRFARNDGLLRAVHAVAGVAETGDDVAVAVEPLVDRSGPDVHVGMMRVKLLDTLRYGEQTEKPDVVAAALLEPIDCRDR